jgi:hypothetical protein
MEVVNVSPVQSAYVSAILSDEERYQRRFITKLSCFTEPIHFQNILNLEEEITSFAALKENWDGYGAVAPHERVISNAVKFVNTLPENLFKSVDAETTPTPYGTIVIDFRVGKELVSIEVGKSQIGFFSKFNDGNDLLLNGVEFDNNKLPHSLILALIKLSTNTRQIESF